MSEPTAHRIAPEWNGTATPAAPPSNPWRLLPELLRNAFASLVLAIGFAASPLDLLATTLKVLLQRAERKDDQDVAVLLGCGLSLADGLGAAKALYGMQFPVRECLKALVYFADGDLAELGLSERRQLEQAVLAVDAIPSLERISSALVPSRG